MAYAKIDYGSVTAELWGSFEKEKTENFFMKHANKCFGIRKSIMGFNILEFDAEKSLPEPWSLMEGAKTVLQHSVDTIVWDENDEKIKSEWD